MAITPFKVIQGHRKLICDFLLVINSTCSLAPILHRFRDSVRWVQNRYIRLPLLCLTPPTEGFSWDYLRTIRSLKISKSSVNGNIPRNYGLNFQCRDSGLSNSQIPGLQSLPGTIPDTFPYLSHFDFISKLRVTLALNHVFIYMFMVTNFFLFIIHPFLTDCGCCCRNPTRKFSVSLMFYSPAGRCTTYFSSVAALYCRARRCK